MMIENGFIGVSRIMLDNTGTTYQPVDEGPEVFITPVRVGQIDTPENSQFEIVPQFGNLIDILAWSPRYPTRWALRCDLAAWLGSIPPQYCLPSPVRIRRSPLSWLRSGGNGLCVLSRNHLDTYRLLSECRALEAEDAAHARELRTFLEHPFKTPPISIGSPEKAAA